MIRSTIFNVEKSKITIETGIINNSYIGSVIHIIFRSCFSYRFILFMFILFNQDVYNESIGQSSQNKSLSLINPSDQLSS